MINRKIVVIAAVPALAAMCLCSCASPQGDQLVTNEQSRFSQQLRGIPDRESSEQESAYNAARRKDDMIKK